MALQKRRLHDQIAMLDSLVAAQAKRQEIVECIGCFIVARPKRSELHPTMKPPELIAHCIKNSSREGDIVLDVFLGSGTTLIAAEQTGRRCYGMEISPAYCDVIVKRWETMTGKQAVLQDKVPA